MFFTVLQARRGGPSEGKQQRTLTNTNRGNDTGGGIAECVKEQMKGECKGGDRSICLCDALLCRIPYGAAVCLS